MTSTAASHHGVFRLNAITQRVKYTQAEEDKHRVVSLRVQPQSEPNTRAKGCCQEGGVGNGNGEEFSPQCCEKSAR